MDVGSMTTSTSVNLRHIASELNTTSREPGARTMNASGDSNTLGPTKQTGIFKLLNPGIPTPKSALRCGLPF